MTYLVTGGTGLLGIKTVLTLIQYGEQVVAYDIAPNMELVKCLIGMENLDKLKIVQGDIHDLANIIRTCKEYNVHKCIHTAGILAPASNANPVLALRTNCEGTINILETARILHLKRVVLVGSVSVFGTPDKHQERYILNDAPHYPQDIYSACKSFNEICSNYYFNVFDVDSVVLRLPGLYGEGQIRGLAGKIAEMFFINPVLGKPSTIPFGDDINNWLYTDDASRALVMASNAVKMNKRVYNVSGDVRSFAQAVECVRGVIPSANIKLLPGYLPLKLSHYVDTAPIEKDLGFNIEWPMEKGFKKVIEYYQNICPVRDSSLWTSGEGQPV